jgi:hypothetical protein
MLDRITILERNTTRAFQVADTSPQTRHRRGLVDAGGWLLNKVFGVATQAQVDAIRHIIHQSAEKQKGVVHVINQLVTVVNSTRHAEQESRQRINLMMKELHEFHHQTELEWANLSTLLQGVQIEAILNRLEAIEQAVYRETTTSKEIRRELEYGRLSEEIFPVHVLEDIIAQARSHSLRPLPRTWYYEHITINLLMMQKELFVYRAQLPFVGNENFLRYHLQTWPVPIDPEGHTAQVITADNVALHTTEGYLFQPTHCLGRQPQVCRTGPRYVHRKLFGCERGLITEHEPDRALCPIRMDAMNKSKLYELDRGRYVLQTMKDAYTLSCRNKAQERDAISRGTYEIYVPPDCTLRGEDWLLQGETLQVVKVDGNTNRLQVRPFNFPTWTKPAVTDEFFTAPSLTPISSLDIQTIHPVIIPYHFGTVGHHISWTTAALIVIIMIVISVAGYWVFKHRKTIKFVFGRPKSPRNKDRKTLESVATKQTDQENID